MREKPGLAKSFAAAMLAVLAAWGSHVLLEPLAGELVPFVTFFPAAFAVAWWGGWRPTLITALLGVPLLAYLVLEPIGSFAIAAPAYRAGLAIWFAFAIATGWFGEQLHVARWKSRQIIENALAEREQLRVTLASMGDGVIVTDEQGLVSSLNSVAERMTGWTAADALGKRLEQVFRIVNEDTRHGIEDPFAKLQRTGAITDAGNHALLIGKDGSERPIDDNAAPILDASGEVRGVIIVFRDVSEKRHAERMLRRNEGELADFFQNAALPMHSVARDGTILRANQAELDMLGYTKEEYIGRHIAHFHVDRHVIDDILTRLSRGGILDNHESRLRCKDGSIKDVLISSSALWEDGKFIHTRCFTRDITERKETQRTLAFLAEASTSLAALVDRERALLQAVRLAVPFLADWCVMYVVGEQGAIDYHAHAHCDPHKERHLRELLTKYPLDWNSDAATVRAIRTGQSQLIKELADAYLDNIARTDEHLVMMRELGSRSLVSVPLRIRDRTIGVIGLVLSDSGRQYTEQHVELAESFAERVATAVDNAQLFQTVKEANRQKDEFLAMLAHELRNPLAAIRYAVALGELSPAESLAELFEIVDRQTQNLARLIDDLLDVSRISRDKVTLRKEYVDVAVIVNRAAAAVRPLVENKEHQLILDVSDRPMPLLADPTRAEQIVANLLTNAAKYTPEGGQISLRAYPQEHEAIIKVSDTGVGLPPEMLSRVFDLFAQADRTLDRSQGGLGIGLTVARKLAEMHGGTITASSDGMGCGATFTIRLPLSESPAIPEQAPKPEARVVGQARLRILIVDDNRDTALSGARLLQNLGHDVKVAFDGPTAVELARSFRPHTLFLDIGLPSMTGYEVARKLRQEGFEQVKIVAISGYGQPDDRLRSREAGFDEHLVKPVDQAELVAVLREVSHGVEEPINASDRLLVTPKIN
jgi:PAS domain S-box-containing protein